MHADNELTFISDYKTIGKELGVDEGLDDSDLLNAVRGRIEARLPWIIIVDNANDLRLFGVGVRGDETTASLFWYIPHAAQGTILWTTRDEHIAGTLVSARQSIEVRSMKQEEAIELFAKARAEASTAGEVAWMPSWKNCNGSHWRFGRLEGSCGGQRR